MAACSRGRHSLTHRASVTHLDQRVGALILRKYFSTMRGLCQQKIPQKNFLLRDFALVGDTRLELVTSTMSTWRSSQLS